MNKRQFYTLVAVAAVAGFVGGAVSDRLFSASAALAARATPKVSAVKPLTAQEFRLVDSAGGTQVRIGFNADGLATVFWNYHGKDPNFQGKEQSIVIATLPGFAPRKPQPQPEK